MKPDTERKILHVLTLCAESELVQLIETDGRTVVPRGCGRGNRRNGQRVQGLSYTGRVSSVDPLGSTVPVAGDSVSHTYDLC